MDDHTREHVRKTAERMRLAYRGHRYSAQERACDHAFWSPIGTPAHAFWRAVDAEITAQETEEREAG
jgi:hypothetical protein